LKKYEDKNTDDEMTDYDLEEKEIFPEERKRK
jgi:hypothetical protein